MPAPISAARLAQLNAMAEAGREAWGEPLDRVRAVVQQWPPAARFALVCETLRNVVQAVPLKDRAFWVQSLIASSQQAGHMPPKPRPMVAEPRIDADAFGAVGPYQAEIKAGSRILSQTVVGIASEGS